MLKIFIVFFIKFIKKINIFNKKILFQFFYLNAYKIKLFLRLQKNNFKLAYFKIKQNVTMQVIFMLCLLPLDAFGPATSEEGLSPMHERIS